MRLSDFHQCRSLSKEELVAHSYGRLVEDAPLNFIRLPAPPILMLDRVTAIERNGPTGRIVAERDVRFDDWFFSCHFIDDPVQPGCLGVDAIWQLIGLYLGLRGAPSSGRALGCKEVEFRGQIRPHNKLVRYEVDIRRYAELPDQGASLAIGTGKIFVDDEHIYSVMDAHVGGFKGIAYTDYPFKSERSVGG
ncbi:MAG: bifunctional 3-hydroxydecanoyl-ACP dehydratase/trans-2-decenoyl-ACP isomerase, partial [Leptospiraceae bacterium]|nr:bifunctional 3-hydroxydecanoyl-ACP dehydratase/trans-2-decenoyl-ACP isomerase [Leptospiraceae bacterium]